MNHVSDNGLHNYDEARKIDLLCTLGIDPHTRLDRTQFSIEELLTIYDVGYSRANSQTLEILQEKLVQMKKEVEKLIFEFKLCPTIVERENSKLMQELQKFSNLSTQLEVINDIKKSLSICLSSIDKYTPSKNLSAKRSKQITAINKLAFIK